MSVKYKTVLGLDISSRSTGWAVLKNGRFYAREGKDYGWIKLKSTIPLAERLNLFRSELVNILTSVRFDAVGIEDVFFSRSPSTLKLLSRFSGVACETVYDICGFEPIIVQVRAVRTVFGTQDKKDIYKHVSDKYKLYKWTYKTHNDITDALAIATYVRKQG